jgi:hypothetical protein
MPYQSSARCSRRAAGSVALRAARAASATSSSKPPKSGFGSSTGGAIDKNPASVRRLLTAKGNPELATVVAIADALDADVVVVPRKKAARRRKPIAAGA